MKKQPGTKEQTCQEFENSIFHNSLTQLGQSISWKI